MLAEVAPARGIISGCEKADAELASNVEAEDGSTAILKSGRNAAATGSINALAMAAACKQCRSDAERRRSNSAHSSVSDNRTATLAKAANSHGAYCASELVTFASISVPPVCSYVWLEEASAVPAQAVPTRAIQSALR